MPTTLRPSPDADLEAIDPTVTKTLPHITLLFWILKISATTLGEAGSDMFAQSLRLGYFVSTVAFIAILIVTLVAQLRSPRYNPSSTGL